ncbi:MAG: hypothetical protein JXA28_05790 [Bacteroidetes bacterium]|nr:hypothetical protein [Bacteroidota bacterium]
MITRFKRQIRNLRIEFTLLGALSLLFILFTMLQKGEYHFGPDLIAGCILSVTNAFLGYVFIERAFRMNNNLFMLFSLAAMTVRFFLMIAAVAVFLITTTTNVVEFVGSFMAFYSAFLIAEVLHINKKTDQIKLEKVPAR